MELTNAVELLESGFEESLSAAQSLKDVIMKQRADKVASSSRYMVQSDREPQDTAKSASRYGAEPPDTESPGSRYSPEPPDTESPGSRYSPELPATATPGSRYSAEPLDTTPTSRYSPEPPDTSASASRYVIQHGSSSSPEPPPPPPPPNPPSPPLKASWSKFYDVTYNSYYYNNAITGESTWERPEGVAEISTNDANHSFEVEALAAEAVEMPETAVDNGEWATEPECRPNGKSPRNSSSSASSSASASASASASTSAFVSINNDNNDENSLVSNDDYIFVPEGAEPPTSIAETVIHSPNLFERSEAMLRAKKLREDAMRKDLALRKELEEDSTHRPVINPRSQGKYFFFFLCNSTPQTRARRILYVTDNRLKNSSLSNLVILIGLTRSLSDMNDWDTKRKEKADLLRKAIADKETAETTYTPRFFTAASSRCDEPTCLSLMSHLYLNTIYFYHSSSSRRESYHHYHYIPFLHLTIIYLYTTCRSAELPFISFISNFFTSSLSTFSSKCGATLSFILHLFIILLALSAELPFDSFISHFFTSSLSALALLHIQLQR
jgi:hypothetical protein